MEPAVFVFMLIILGAGAVSLLMLCGSILLDSIRQFRGR